MGGILRRDQFTVLFNFKNIGKIRIKIRKLFKFFPWRLRKQGFKYLYTAVKRLRFGGIQFLLPLPLFLPRIIIRNIVQPRFNRIIAVSFPVFSSTAAGRPAVRIFRIIRLYGNGCYFIRFPKPQKLAVVFAVFPEE